MTHYRVSDGAMSYQVEAASPEDAAADVFGPGYDWGSTPEDLGDEDCITSDMRYAVWEQDEGEDIGFSVLSGPLSDYR